MKHKFIDYYMDIAELTSKLSSAIRLNVGAVIVKGNKILGTGYNGMPTGWSNECEYKDFMSVDAGGWLNPDEIYERWPLEEYDSELESNRRYRLVTKDEVLHAEMNAIAKVSASTESSEGSTLFITHAPCIHCAKAIYQSGIKNVFYREAYRDTKGLEFLDKGGVNVTKYPIQD
jgi:dCMP deaminase